MIQDNKYLKSEPCFVRAREEKYVVEVIPPIFDENKRWNITKTKDDSDLLCSKKVFIQEQDALEYADQQINNQRKIRYYVIKE